MQALTALVLLHLPAWLLVLFRITGIFILSPMLGGVAIPRPIKVIFAFTLSLCIYPILVPVNLTHPPTPAQQDMVRIMTAHFSIWSLAPMVATELLIGLVIGYVATLPLAGVQLGGRIIDQQMGLAFAQIVNPELGEQSSPIAEAYFMAVMAFFIIANGHLVMVDILLSTFQHVGLGTFQADDFLANFLVMLVDLTIRLAIHIAAPLLAIVFLSEAAMGFMMRSVPQINIMTTGFIVRILVGAVVLIGTNQLMYELFDESWRSFLFQLKMLFAQ